MYTFCHKKVPSGIGIFQRVSGKGMMTLIFLLFLNLISLGQIAPVNPPSGGFHIDGDLRANTPTAGVGDWVPGSAGSGGHVFSLTGVPVDPANSFLLNDAYSTNSDDVFSGSSMADNPNNWKWALSSAPAKNEMNRGMIHLSPDASGDVWIMAGADRLSTNGTAYIDFELLQNTLVKNPGGTFTSAGPHGGRTIGDLLITMLYNNGGGVSTIFYYRWQALTGGGYGFVAITPGLLGFAITNPAVVDVPFGAFGATTYNKFQFVEAAINLSQVVSFVTNDPCVRLSIQTIFIKTKASTSTTAALKDLLEPIQVNFSVGGVNITPVGTQCLNGSPVTLTGVPPGGIFSGPGVSGNTFTPSVAGLGNHQIIYTKEIVAGCIKRDTIYIQVITTVGGSVTGGTTVCSGSNSGTLTLSGHTGSVIKWQSSPDGISWTDIANTSTSLNFTNLTATTRYRAVVKNGDCDAANSTPAIVTVDASSVGGTVSGGRQTCISDNSGTLTLSGQVGSVIKWQSSTNNGTSWTDIANTTSTLAYSNLTVSTRFRAVVQSGVCPSANSSDALIAIDPLSQGGSIAGGTTVCSGTNSSTLNLSGHVGSVVKWQQSTNGGSSYTDISSTAGLTSYAFSNLTQTTVYRAVVKSGVCDAVNSTPATVTVDVPSVGGAVSGSRAVCISGNSGTLTLSGHTGSVVKWQSSTNNGSSWTDIANTTTTLTYNNLTTATRFRAVVQSGVCAPANSSEAIITIDPISVGGSLAGSTHVCGGSNSGTISLSGQVGTVVKWQQSTNGGSSFTDIAGTAGQTSYTFSNLTQTTIFRAVVKSGSCDQVNSSPATVTVDPATDPGSIEGPAAVCDNAGSSILTLTNYTGSILKWQMSNDGITWMDIANTSATHDIGLITNRMYYRAVVKSGMCDAEYSPTFTVLVIACGPTSNHCTYTQGFYGNEGGLGCSIDPTGLTGNSYELAKTKMLRAFQLFGAGKVVFGRADINADPLNDRAFTLYRDDIDNDNIFKMLPGGGTQLVLGVKPGGTAYGSAFQGATFADQSTWNAVPMIPAGSGFGTVKNTLLAQTMTLFFNLHNGTNLGFVVLHDTLYVVDIDCVTGNPDSGAVAMKYGLPHEVLVYIAQNSTVYSNNVAGLYKLANDVLGGLETPGLSPALVANAVDQINRAFDECRALVGSYDLPLNTSILSAIPYQQMERSSVMSDKSSLLVETYPNPFRDKISFRITPEESGIGALDIYSSSGQKLRTVFRGYLPAGITRIIEYTVPESQVGSMIYQFQLGKKRVSGKLISLSR